MQGCCAELEELLARLRFNADRDLLWFTGDLVNRGPQSLATLRRVSALADNAIVVPLSSDPVVVRGARAGLDGGFVDLGLAQWADTITFPDTYVTSGPESWPHADLSVRRTRGPGKLRDTRGTGVTLRPARPVVAPVLPAVVVSDVNLQPTSVSFTVDRTGVPVLVRMSWAPGWRTSGAGRILRAAPNFIVVVPTAKNVRITMSRTSSEHAGNALSALGIAALGALTVADRRRRRADIPPRRTTPDVRIAENEHGVADTPEPSDDAEHDMAHSELATPELRAEDSAPAEPEPAQLD